MIFFNRINIHETNVWWTWVNNLENQKADFLFDIASSQIIRTK